VEYRYSLKQFILNQDNGWVQKFPRRVNCAHGDELTLFVDESDPRAGGLSHSSVFDNMSGAQHLPMSHAFAPLAAEPRERH
jgi:hypothetical protein